MTGGHHRGVCAAQSVWIGLLAALPILLVTAPNSVADCDDSGTTTVCANGTVRGDSDAPPSDNGAPTRSGVDCDDIATTTVCAHGNVGDNRQAPPPEDTDGPGTTDCDDLSGVTICAAGITRANPEDPAAGDMSAPDRCADNGYCSDRDLDGLRRYLPEPP